MTSFTPINRWPQTAAPLHPQWVAEAEQEAPSGQGSAVGEESEVEVENGLYVGTANSDVESEYEDENDERPASAQKENHRYNSGRQDDENDDEWDKTHSEIASMCSEDLHETRPNRFKGYPSTWRKWTKNDRETWRSLEKVRMNDLGVHLYNAFVLQRDAKIKIAEEKAKAKVTKGKGKGKAKGKAKTKEREMDVPMSGQGETGDEEDGEENEEGGSVWAPQKTWTAWPAYERGYERLGNGDLLAGLAGIDRVDEKLPGDNLREEIGAAILRAAKERFYQRREKRKRGEEQGVENDENAMEIDEPEASASNGRAPEPKSRPAKRKRSPSYEPVLRADDEVNYNMLRPVTAQIMEKLDDTLTLLHHARVSTMRLSLARPKEGGSENTATEVDSNADTKSGADTEADQTPRRARSRSKSVDGEQKIEVGKKRPPRSRSRAGSIDTASKLTMLTKHHFKLMSKLNLRDWRDVISAAAMAGFEPDVIARAAQRCATLFQQEITLNTLHEVPLTGSARPGVTGVETLRYTPGNLAVGREESDLSSEEDNEEGGEEDREGEGDEGEEGEEGQNEEEEEEEEAEHYMDEIHGGVHVDGFLRPIGFSDDDWESETSGLEEALEEMDVSNRGEEDENDEEGEDSGQDEDEGGKDGNGVDEVESLVYSSS